MNPLFKYFACLSRKRNSSDSDWAVNKACYGWNVLQCTMCTSCVNFHKLLWALKQTSCVWWNPNLAAFFERPRPFWFSVVTFKVLQAFHASFYPLIIITSDFWHQQATLIGKVVFLYICIYICICIQRCMYAVNIPRIALCQFTQENNYARCWKTLTINVLLQHQNNY